MKKIKLFTSLLGLSAIAGVSTAVSCSCNSTKIEITGVEHGTVECSAFKLNEQFIVTYKPEKGWKLDYAIITIAGKILKPGTSEDYMIVGNVITIFSKSVTSNDIKIKIVEAKDDTTKCSLLYKHLLTDTSEYFQWDATNPIVCEKADKTTTIKIKKIKACDGIFSSPKIKAESTVTISTTQDVDLSDSKFPVGQTKTYTFTWEKDPQDIAFIVYVDTILIQTVIPSIDRNVFQFIDLPTRINSLSKTITIKFQYTKDQTYTNPRMLADFVASPAIAQQTKSISAKAGEQTWDLTWTGDPQMITFTLESTPK